MASDPFTESYQTILSNISKDQYLSKIFKTIIDLSNPKFTKFKDEVSSSDLPELVVLPATCSLKPLGTNSKTSTAKIDFVLVCTFDTLQVNNPLQTLFLLLRSFVLAGDTLYQLPYIRDVNIKAGLNDLFGKEPWSRSATRQVLTITITPEYSFSTVSLTNFTPSI